MAQRRLFSYNVYVKSCLTAMIGTKSNPSVIHEKDLNALLRCASQSEYLSRLVELLHKKEHHTVLPESEGGSLFYPRMEELEAHFADNQPVLMYLEELKRNGIDRCLAPEEEDALALRCGEDPAAAESLKNGNLLRVVSLAREYMGLGMDILDLLTEGNNGLDSAIHAFGADPRPTFLPIVVCKIREAFDFGLRFCTDVRMRSGKAEFRELAEIWRKEEATAEERAALLADALEPFLDLLTPREADVIRYRFGVLDGYSHSLEETGARFGITRERVRQIENKAIRRFVQPARRRAIRNFYFSDDVPPSVVKVENPSEDSGDGEIVGEILV